MIRKNHVLKQASPVFGECPVNLACALLTSPSTDWSESQYDILHQDFYKYRLSALVLASDIFLGLGNTGAAVHRRWTADIALNTIPDGPSINKWPLKQIAPHGAALVLLQFRHPDPNRSAKLTLKNPDLQVSGSWQKIQLKKPGTIQPKLGFASFVWKSAYLPLTSSTAGS